MSCKPDGRKGNVTGVACSCLKLRKVFQKRLRSDPLPFLPSFTDVGVAYGSGSAALFLLVALTTTRQGGVKWPGCETLLLDIDVVFTFDIYSFMLCLEFQKAFDSVTFPDAIGVLQAVGAPQRCLCRSTNGRTLSTTVMFTPWRRWACLRETCLVHLSRFVAESAGPSSEASCAGTAEFLVPTLIPWLPGMLAAQRVWGRLKR